jgi:hypothetical protein
MADSSLASIQHLETLRDRYRYGWISYYQAQVYLSIGDVEQALNKLEQAFDEGMFFMGTTMDQDPDLIPLFDHPRFQKLLHPLGELE